MGKPSGRNYLGQTVGRLTVVEYLGTVKKQAQWRAVCSCGKEKLTCSRYLRISKCPSCGCNKSEIASRVHKGKRGVHTLEPGVASSRYVMRAYVHGAKLRGLSWDLTEAEFLVITQKPCFYCGSAPSNRGKQASVAGKVNGVYIYTGIDRIDNNKGYTTDNCTPCCKNCNVAKNNMPLAEFVSWVSRCYNNLILKQA